MDPRDAELLARLLPTFRQEAEEHLRQIERRLAELMQKPSPQTIEETFREVHSLKGAARAVGAGELEELCQQMEAVFAALGKSDEAPGQNLIDLLLLATDLAADLARAAGERIPAELQPLVSLTRQRLAQVAAGQTVEEPSPLPRPTLEASPPLPQAPAETLRIGAGTIEQVLLQAEELLAEKLAARGQAAALREVLGTLGDLRRSLRLAAAERRSLQRRGDDRPGAGEDHLWRALDEAMQTASGLENSTRETLRRADEHTRFLGLKVDSLIDAVRATLMLPVSFLLEPLPRMVRDLAREAGKGVDLESSGGEIQVDRRLLEALRTPLLHLLRNAIDHGLEMPEERRSAGKPARGRLRVSASAPSPRRVMITLSDDGRGLDLERLKAAAVRSGHLEPAAVAELDDLQAAELAFVSGLTTADDLSTVSGRGLGLPIVREKVERLGGQVQIASRPGQGTTFQLEIPATLAAFRGVLTRLGQTHYIFPSEGVERVLRVPAQTLQSTGHRPLIELAGAPLPVVHLEEPLRLPLSMHSGEEILSLVVAASSRGRVAFAVDEIVGEQEFLVKDLGGELVNVPTFSGSALLGDGGIALVVDPQSLVAGAGGAPASIAEAAAEAQPTRRRVLVVEDSITSRTLLRNILESAGYSVVTAVDGLDALERLAATDIDIVVSDVEMPRLDGFRLTGRIREKYGRLPVILVTGREEAEDRQRGLEAGADAYLVKSRFDQGNLLEVIGRLT